MSTRANVVVNGYKFYVESDGQDESEVLATVKSYVAECKHKVTEPYLVEAVVNAICADRCFGYGWLVPGELDGVCIDYAWEVMVSDDGKVEIRNVTEGLG